MSEQKQPTLRDVAQKTGVSIYTVSTVLNGSRSNTRVAPDTRKRIQVVAAELGYRPHALARGLARRRINSMGVLFGVTNSEEVVTNPYASGILQGIMIGAARTGNDVLLFTKSWDGADSARACSDHRVDGILMVAPTLDSDMVSCISALHLPAVAISCPDDDPNIIAIDVDNSYGARLATEHLIELGHRKIAHLMGNDNLMSVLQRRDSFLDTMRNHELPVSSSYLVPCTYDAATVAERMGELFELPEPPTAIFAGNDAIAMAACEWARTSGVQIPDQLSIIGFDDVPAAAVITPALTTIRQPLSDIGQEAARLLNQVIDSKETVCRKNLMPPKLVMRGTTGRRCPTCS